MEEQSRPMKAVWTMVERTQSGSGNAKSYWTRVGVGFVNRDGSITLKLDALPVNGTLQIREWEPYEKKQDWTDGQRLRQRPQTAPIGDSLI